jgi:type IV pilus assembly protein PilA
MPRADTATIKGLVDGRSQPPVQVLPVMSLVCLAALGGCNLVRGPTKDGECRANLRTILSAEVSLYSEQQRYTTHPAEVGFAPVPGNRYLYLFDAQGGVTRRDDQPSPPLHESVGIGPDTRARGVTVEWLRDRFPPALLAGLGIQGRCPGCELVLGCAGNIDDDGTVDVWTISSADRVIEGTPVARGTPFRHLNDREH